MFQVHKFNIGRPDNLVNIGEFVDILQQRLDNLQCLYCEKTYKSSAVLKQRIVSRSTYFFETTKHLTVSRYEKEKTFQN
jgi:hypothetical protein